MSYSQNRLVALARDFVGAYPGISNSLGYQGIVWPAARDLPALSLPRTCCGREGGSLPEVGGGVRCLSRTSHARPPRRTECLSRDNEEETARAPGPLEQISQSRPASGLGLSHFQYKYKRFILIWKRAQYKPTLGLRVIKKKRKPALKTACWRRGAGPHARGDAHGSARHAPPRPKRGAGGGGGS